MGIMGAETPPSRVSSERGGPHVVGTIREAEIPPSRVSSEGGVGELWWAGKGRRNPSDSRFKRGRGVGGDSGVDRGCSICKNT
jgi:hypothetical protein